MQNIPHTVATGARTNQQMFALASEAMQVFRYFLGQFTVYGAGYGAACGAGIGLPVLIVGAIVGCPFGAIIGLVLGFFDGIMIGLVAGALTFCGVSMARMSRTICALAPFATAIGSVGLARILTPPYIILDTNSIENTYKIDMVIGAIAAIVSWYAACKIVDEAIY